MAQFSAGVRACTTARSREGLALAASTARQHYPAPQTGASAADRGPWALPVEHGTSLPLYMTSARLWWAPHATWEVRNDALSPHVQLTLTGVAVQQVPE